MILNLPQVVREDERSEIRAIIDAAPLRDGASTAGPLARDVKRNREVPLDSPVVARARDLLTRGLHRTKLFEAWALPRAVSPLLFVRYEAGDAYGDHSDDGVLTLPGGRFLRTDLAITIFLSPPEEYEGGELVIETDGAARRFKLAAGDAIVYPATTLHRVEPVRSGVRVVAVGWIESLIRAADQREAVFDLLRALSSLVDADVPARGLVMKVRTNLLRMWSES